MSTTLEVYPGTERIPSVGEVLETAERELTAFLARRGVRVPIEMRVALDDGHPRLLEPGAPFACGRDAQMWVTIAGVAGGVDVHRHGNDLSGLHEGPRAGEVADLDRYLATGHHWAFRRSMGQPGVVNLACGLLAGTVARLTDGLVFSDDGAWEWERMPMRPEQFLGDFFVPERTADPELRAWALRCLENVERDFGPRPPG